MMTDIGDEQIVESNQNFEMKSYSNNNTDLQLYNITFFGLSGQQEGEIQCLPQYLRKQSFDISHSLLEQESQMNESIKTHNSPNKDEYRAIKNSL